jgi:hypothetical protein
MEAAGNATQRTNLGGWHYAFDLFAVDEPVIAAFRDQMEQHVQAFLNQLRRKQTQQGEIDFDFRAGSMSTTLATRTPCTATLAASFRARIM